MAGIGACATANMFESEIVITQVQFNKTISLWTHHDDTVRRVKELIEECEGIPQEGQKLLFQCKGILDDNFRMGNLYTSADA